MVPDLLERFTELLKAFGVMLGELHGGWLTLDDTRAGNDGRAKRTGRVQMGRTK